MVLPKYTLEYIKAKDRWALERDKTGRTVKTFAKKESATRGGVLSRIVGIDGGSVKIQKQNGRFQEERTYPRSKDPRKSKG